MKPLLIGLHNPYSERAADALAPFPDHSAGHRLWRTLADLRGSAILSASALMAAVNKHAYMEAFDRRNLFVGPYPKTRLERHERAWRMLRSIPDGACAIVLGVDVAQAFGTLLEEPLHKTLIHPQVRNGVTWRLLPHPSGRSTFYNDPITRTLVGMTLADAISQHSTGEPE